jgi:EAL domain-containing protein (putative c-di-GMP-specific phosphodiesterase class I)
VRDPEAMLMQADLALYRAKELGRNGFSLHSDDLDLQIRERVTVAEEIRLAVARGELELCYQPQVRIGSGHIVGMEALVRWNHPKRGRLSPAVFIAIAERTGTIVPLGRWAIGEVCRQTKLWEDEGIAPATVAVNVSAAQFKQTNVAREIAESLKQSGVTPGLIEVELTESVLMEVTGENRDIVERLRNLGIRIAIDDFGTGYSSLNYLTSYPVDRLKIAQELIFGVPGEKRYASVVKAAIRLANELRIEIIAEGVETLTQALYLASEGCEFAQGYYYSHPLPVAAATELLRKGVCKPGVEARPAAPPTPQRKSA